MYQAAMPDMLLNRYVFKWIGRCQYDTSDKVWGWFYHVDPERGERPLDRHAYCYVFWGATGKTLSFNRKINNHYDMIGLQRAKISRKYQQIDMDTFCSLWENIEEQWSSRFVLHLLSNQD